MSVKFSTSAELEIVGRVTKDPEMKYTPEGKAVTTINVVHNEFGGKDPGTGKSVTYPMWVKLSAWEKDAENLSQYLKKGDIIQAKGKIHFDHATGGPRVWTPQDGSAPRGSFEMTISSCTIISSKNGSSDTGSSDIDDFVPANTQWGQPAPVPSSAPQPQGAPAWGQTQAQPQYQPAPQPVYVPAPAQPQGNGGGFTVPQQPAQPQYQQPQQQQFQQAPQQPQQYQGPQQPQQPQQAQNNQQPRPW
jgi:single-strand DNA-binding protein